MGFVSSIRRLWSSDAELEREEQQRDVQACGATPVTSCSDRDVVRLRGRIENVTLPTADHSRTYEVEFSDGSGTVHLTWMGRDHIPGVVVGCTLIVEGRISCQGSKRRMYNPKYQLLQVPDQTH